MGLRAAAGRSRAAKDVVRPQRRVEGGCKHSRILGVSARPSFLHRLSSRVRWTGVLPVIGLGVASCTIETPDKENQPRVEESDGGEGSSGNLSGGVQSESGASGATQGQDTQSAGTQESASGSGGGSDTSSSTLATTPSTGSGATTGASGNSDSTGTANQSSSETPTSTTSTSGTTDTSSSCAKAEVKFDPVIPTIYMLVDRSGSMDWSIDSDDQNPRANESRWEVVKQALLAQGGNGTPEGVIRRIQDQAYLTASLYHTSGSECPAMTHAGDGKPKLSNLLPIKSMFDSFGPANGTPSAESIFKVWEQIDDDTRENKIFVFATDGEPSNYTSCSDQNGVSKTLPSSVTMHDTQNQPGPLAKERAVRVVHQMRESGIPTFVIGVGPAAIQAGLGDHLDELARAGAGVNVYLQPGQPGYVPPGDPAYPKNPVPNAGNGENDAFFFKGNSSELLYQAFESIIIGSRPCKFTLKNAILDGFQDTGELSINGVKKTLKDPNGWRVNSLTEIEVLGSSCTQIRENADVDLKVEFSCEAVQPG